MGKPKGEFVFFTRPKPPAPNPAEAAWQAALAADILVAYDDFLEQHPDSPHAEEAETRIRALEEALAKTQLDELTLFIQTQDSHSLSDVRDYLKTYPQGQYIKEVQALRERLRNQLPSTSSLANENPPPAESPVNPALQVTKHVPHVNFTETVSGVSFNMIYVESGEFMMGDTFGEGNRDELPVHPVILDGCYLGETVVTQSLYRAVTGRNPSYFKLGDEHPVEQVSWDDAQDFIQKLNQYTGKKYTLPTEAQWEFAARGGTKSRGYLYAGSDKIDEVAWYDGNYQQSRHGSQGTTHPVATKKANELGFYDMSGNLWEWCQDWYDEKFYDTSEARARNPVNLKQGSYRVGRGGS
jgi:formylglycine-generating enzyme required for sulfatase activity